MQKHWDSRHLKFYTQIFICPEIYEQIFTALRVCSDFSLLHHHSSRTLDINCRLMLMASEQQPTHNDHSVCGRALSQALTSICGLQLDELKNKNKMWLFYVGITQEHSLWRLRRLTQSTTENFSSISQEYIALVILHSALKIEHALLPPWTVGW